MSAWNVGFMERLLFKWEPPIRLLTLPILLLTLVGSSMRLEAWSLMQRPVIFIQLSRLLHKVRDRGLQSFSLDVLAIRIGICSSFTTNLFNPAIR